MTNRRAIPYPAGKRHTGIDAAIQPDLFRYRSAALPAGAPPAKHAPAGDANRLTQEHDQQGISPAGNRWGSGSHGRLRHLRAGSAKTARSQKPATHPQPERYGSRQRGM